MKTETEIFIKMVVGAWETQNGRVNKLLDTLSEEQWMEETAPGRNRGIYLIGHLAAVSDGMFPILGWGARLFPELESIFVSKPDRAVELIPSLADIKKKWNQINAKIAEYIRQTSPEEWFARHTAVSADDFAKEPHRNKLNILVNRTNHHAYHLGQLIYLGKRTGDE